MITYVTLGIAAGLVSAILFAAASTGSVASAMLIYLAPLPILIVALGWHHLLGLLALSVGAFALSVGLRSSTGIAFALGPGFAAWFPAYLVLLARPPLSANDGGALRWLPVGHILFWLAMTAAAIACTAIYAATGGDLERYREALEQTATELMQRSSGSGRGSASPESLGIPARDFAAMMLWLAPAAFGFALTLMLAANLWLASKAVAISGRLVRPWPDIPLTRMPAAAAIVLLAAILATGMSGLAGFAAMSLIGALGVAFALQGMAVMHDVTRGKQARSLILTTTYVFVALFSYVLLPVFALLGLADSLLPFRKGRAAPPPPSI
ncbi:DUF2232 domain-containing protein [Enterovirga rhinocerotis]|uniref:Putative membrane protein DUF2232 n=1 Tax=Enterovirga rhinocerotis TaxID=1339210 RepID=A0A4R7C585_9HYPH|nr:DUF2232 domain-containing protein [Enterovirga rhinocerotis]TDR93714.1 putative membrane protein DUF2232 [Enterovirga rhinocerotis]